MTRYTKDGKYISFGGLQLSTPTPDPRFIIKIDTTNEGSPDNTMTLPLVIGKSYDFNIDWGDGNSETYLSSSISAVTHIYNLSGIYTIKIEGIFPNIYFNNDGDKLKLIDIINFGDVGFSFYNFSFNGCMNLISDIKIPKYIKILGMYCFANTRIKSISFPDGLTDVGRGAFNYCTEIKNLTLPNSLTFINTYAFWGCSGLTGDLIIPDNVTSIGNRSFYGCGFDGNLFLPDGLTSIVNSAFSNCNFTGDLIIPGGVTIIDLSVFENCNFNGVLNLPSGITSIGNLAFKNCPFSNTLNLPNGLTNIGSNAFDGCVGFSGTLTIPNTVTTIGQYVFSYCNFTGDLIIPSSITDISRGAFRSCNNFTGKLSIPSTVTRIQEYAFFDAGVFDRMDIYCDPAIIPEGVNSFNFNSDAFPVHVQSGATGYDVSPWTDTSKFSEIIYDL